MAIVRTTDHLAVVDGAVRSLEWYWAADGTMPGLDAFDALDSEQQAAVIATFRHWADLPHGMASTMNAIEARGARRRAGKATLEDRLRQDPEMAQRIDKQLAHLRLEQQMADAMQRQHVSAAELARRVSRQPSAISRDLKGGLSKAKIGRVEDMAEAVDHDFVALVLPRDPKERRETLERLTRELVH